jgi:hypothetical protein
LRQRRAARPRLDVDALDQRVRVRRTQEYAHRHIRPLDVGDVVALAGNEPAVFLAQDRGANACMNIHDQPPAWVCMAAAPASTAATMF